MNLLLDTHVYLWWEENSPSLLEPVRAAIVDRSNTIFVSAATVWEIAIKRRLGKLGVRGSVVESIHDNRFVALPMSPEDAELAGGLPWTHNDPFDRMLVAQAVRLGMTLVTADRIIRAFGGVNQMWADG